jgi:hypothetical protein
MSILVRNGFAIDNPLTRTEIVDEKKAKLFLLGCLKGKN